MECSLEQSSEQENENLKEREDAYGRDQLNRKVIGGIERLGNSLVIECAYEEERPEKQHYGRAEYILGQIVFLHFSPNLFYLCTQRCSTTYMIAHFCSFVQYLHIKNESPSVLEQAKMKCGLPQKIRIL